MIWKLIRATVKPGCREEFIRRQRTWNDVMSRQQGFRSIAIATDPTDPLSVTILIGMHSREDLDRFMAGDHDPTFAATRMRELYDRLDISVLDVIEPGPQEIRLEAAPSRSGPAHQLLLLGQLFRVSAVVRAALVGGVFDAVAGGTTRAALRERWPGAPHLDRLLEALSALGLLVLDADGGGSVAPTAIAARHLVRDSPEFVGDAILHDTKPLIWRRFGSLDERLGLPAVHPHSDDGGDEHALFLRAMTSVAAASQARSLLAAVDFTGARRLLDVGGARGDYAIAICAHVPDLHAVVLDLPKSEPLAMDRLRDAPPAVASRISFVGGDYRRELPGGFDTILLSNVLRGEVLAEARALLDRCAAGLLPGGRLVIQDLFPDDPAGRGPLAAALFGLHMPEAANPSVDATVALLRDGGWLDVEVRPIDGYVVADRAVVARKP